MIIDRFEGKYAVIEKNNGESPEAFILKEKLPEEAKEGDIITESGGVYVIDRDKTEKKRREIVEKMKKLKFRTQTEDNRLR